MIVFYSVYRIIHCFLFFYLLPSFIVRSKYEQFIPISLILSFSKLKKEYSPVLKKNCLNTFNA